MHVGLPFILALGLLTIYFATTISRKILIIMQITFFLSFFYQCQCYHYINVYIWDWDWVKRSREKTVKSFNGPPQHVLNIFGFLFIFISTFSTFSALKMYSNMHARWRQMIVFITLIILLYVVSYFIFLYFIKKNLFCPHLFYSRSTWFYILKRKLDG